MRINRANKTADMEERDIAYFFPAYIVSYNYYTKGEDPVEIVLPMFSKVEHPRKPGTFIPIRYIPVASDEAQDIIKDGSNIPITSESALTEMDDKDEQIRQLQEKIKELSPTEDDAPMPLMEKVEEPEPVQPETPPDNLPTLPDREPKPPENPAYGSSDNMQPRDRADLAKTKKDLLDDPEIDESKEKPFEKPITRDETGAPKIEE